MRLSPILLSVALLCASGQLMAMEARQMGPDGSGSCPESTTAGDATNDADVDADAAAAPARRTQKTKPAPTPRASNGGSNRGSTPRWHSFLPGMFR